MAEEKHGNNFCSEMRKATREIHAISDALVNAKLLLGLHNDKVWANGLLIFYEIFQFLEKSIERQKDHNLNIERFQFITDLNRAQAFKDDLDFYLGKDWIKSYIPRDEVKHYLNYLHELEKNNPTFLLAYIYHLYMGLLSGGQILRKKRQLINRLNPLNFNFEDNKNIDDINGDSYRQQNDGYKVTYFDGQSISEIKSKIRSAMNEVAGKFDDNTKQQLIEESKTVFALNNQIIRSVEGVGAAILKRIFFILFIFIISVVIYLFVF